MRLPVLPAFIFAACLMPALAPSNANAALAPESETEQSAVSDFGDLPQVRWVIETVRSGDTLLKIFRRADFSTKIGLRLSRMPEARLLNVIRPGDEVRFAHDAKGELLGVEYRQTDSRKASFLIVDGSIEAVSKRQLEKVGSLAAILEKIYEEGPGAAKLPMPEIDPSRLSWNSVKVKRGDTLTQIFRKVGLPVRTAIDVADSRGGAWLRNLRVGQELRIATHSDGEFAVLEAHTTALRTAIVIAGDGYFYHTERTIKPDVQQHQGCGTIAVNLFDSGEKVGFNHRVLQEYVNVFGSRIDFARELISGDEFCIIYEQQYLKQGKPVGNPVILAGTYRSGDDAVYAVRFEDPQLGERYYDQNGENLRGHFLRSPLKYARVTSKFSKRRFHPVLKRWRPHKGVDYGAPSGTPVMSTADGVVVKRKYDGNYGNLVQIRHGGKYKTVYAHLKGFASGIRVGSRVKQGQVIGYVGNTGLSTGSHLHYEFRVNDVHHDPLKYALPNGKPVNKDYLDEFLASSEVWVAQIESINRDKPLLAYTPSEIDDELPESADNTQQQ